MALYPTNFTCFDDVERAYTTTKPLGGTKRKGQDVRPIGDRARPWERIVKIDDDCYALSDGHHRGDALFPHWGGAASGLTLADMELFAPIVWRRYGQGVERVTIRNGTGPYMHTTRYMFLSRHMPSGLIFVQTQQGKQFVKVRGVETPLFLAKGTHVTAAEYAQVLAQQGNSALRRVNNWATGTTDTTSLVFQSHGRGRWEFISHNGVAPAVPRILVDKEAKAAFKDAIRSFVDWAFVMAPMIDIEDYGVRREYEQQLDDWCTENKITQVRSWGTMSRRLPKELARDIVMNPDHPLRVVMMVAMMREIDFSRRPITEQADITAIRAKINQWMNKTLQFTKKG